MDCLALVQFGPLAKGVAMGNFFAQQAANYQRLLKRSCESLLGICTGLLADRVLSDEEIRFLDTWLAENSDIATVWPGDVIYSRVQHVLNDGIITEEERDNLKKTLVDLIGNDFEQTGVTSGLATNLPIDDVPEILIPGNSFCFTGAFLYGTRKACENAITSRGGYTYPTVRINLDYLVIGTLASHEWAHTSHGRKIELALDYKKKGRTIFIISEKQWIQFL
jgi:NAD-dependent DNA ligase